MTEVAVDCSKNIRYQNFKVTLHFKQTIPHLNTRGKPTTNLQDYDFQKRSKSSKQLVARRNRILRIYPHSIFLATRGGTPEEGEKSE